MKHIRCKVMLDVETYYHDDISDAETVAIHIEEDLNFKNSPWNIHSISVVEEILDERLSAEGGEQDGAD